uniref:ENTH domain-containing protein n=1 Tax=Spongospora subterranea TaxID=70186 RepID=A0A0H5QFB5_9EUKA|eukprot:CRZ00733.1 hypothetical protein [Spongospora subterranea]
MSLVKQRLRTMLRSAKDSIKDYNMAERRVRAVTSNEPWPASSRSMMAVCGDMKDPGLYDSILIMLLKRIQDRSQILHVKKSLQLVDFCLRHALQRFVDDMKARRHVFLSLSKYRFLVHGQDKGAEIRAKSDCILALLDDDGRLITERETARRTRSRISGFGYQMVPHRNVPQRSPLNSPSSSTVSTTITKSSSSSDDSSSVQLPIIVAPRRKQRVPAASGGSVAPSPTDNWLLDLVSGSAPAVHDPSKENMMLDWSLPQNQYPEPKTLRLDCSPIPQNNTKNNRKNPKTNDLLFL